MALALEDISWGTADHWMRMQASYELAQARRDRGRRRAAVKPRPHMTRQCASAAGRVTAIAGGLRQRVWTAPSLASTTLNERRQVGQVRVVFGPLDAAQFGRRFVRSDLYRLREPQGLCGAALVFPTSSH